MPFNEQDIDGLLADEGSAAPAGVTEDDVAQMLADPEPSPPPGAVASRFTLAEERPWEAFAPEPQRRRYPSSVDNLPGRSDDNPAFLGIGATRQDFAAFRLQHIFEASLDGAPDQKAGVLELRTRLRDETGIAPPREVIERRYDDFKRTWETSQYDVTRWMRENPDLAQIALERPELGEIALKDPQLNVIQKALAWQVELPQWLADAAGRTEEHPMYRPGMMLERLSSPVAAAKGAFSDIKARFGDAPQQPTAPAGPQGQLVREDSLAKQINQLSGTERATSILFDRYEEARQGLETSLLGYSLMQRRMANEMGLGKTFGPGDLDTYETQQALLDRQREGFRRNLKEGPFEQFLSDTAEMGASQVQVLKDAGLAAGGAALVAGGATLAYTRNPKIAAKNAMSAASFFGKAGMFVSSMRMEAGGAYLDLDSATTDAGEKLTEKEKYGAATIYGLLSATVEVASESRQLSGLGDLGNAIAGGEKRAALAVLKEQLKDRQFRAIASKAAEEWIKAGATEGTEEFVQDVMKQLTDYATKSAHDKRLQAGPAVDFAQAQDAFIKAAGPASFMGGPSLIAKVVAAHIQDVSTSHGDAILQTIRENVKDSPTARADPQAVAKLVEMQTAANGEAVTHAYIDPTAFIRVFQEQGVDPQAVATEILGESGAQQLKEAVASGGKLEVPMAAYISKMTSSGAADALADHTATQPGHLTPAERAAQADRIEAEAKRIAEEGVAPESEEGKFVAALDARQQQLSDTKRLSKKDAKTSFAPMLAMFRTMAERFNVGADDLFRDLRLSIERGDEGKAAPAAPTKRAAQAAAASQLLSERLIGTDGTPALGVEQRARELYFDPVSGLRNRRGWDESPRQDGKQIAVITTPDIKAINDDPTGGHDTSNALLRTIGNAVAGIDPEAARSGTNFLLHVKDEAELATALDLIREAMPDKAIVLEGATGADLDSAFTALDNSTETKRAAGTLPARGQTNLDLSKLDSIKFAEQPAKTDLPINLKARAGALTDAEHFREAYQDRDVPGVLSATGWASIPRKKFVASLDLKGLKKINDTIGKPAGTEVLRIFGAAAKDIFGQDFDFAHLSGDEYAAQHDDRAALEQWVADLGAELQYVRPKHTLPSGQTITLKAEFRHGIGEGTYGAADRDLNARKRAEAAGGNDVRGVRGPAGEAPGTQGRNDGDHVPGDGDLAQRPDRPERRGAAGQDFLAEEVVRAFQGYEQTPAVTTTPEFRKWFGDSKIVDENGAPLRVYHGTPTAGHDEFRSAKFKNVAGYFAKDPAVAGMAAEDGNGGSVYPVFLSIKRPVDLSALDGSKLLTVDEFSDALPFDVPDDVRSRYKNFLASKGYRPVAPIWSFISGDTFRDLMRQHGFDGIIYNEMSAADLNDLVGPGEDKIREATSYVAFEPGQVKSATGNRGTFDPANPNILYQGGDHGSGPKGYTDIAKKGALRILRIGLNGTSDKSTFLHEMGHTFLEIMGDLSERADAPESVKQDWQAAMKYLGVDKREDIKTEHHEKWARSFEAYLMEGKAPSARLAGAFEKFKLWLTDIYRTMRALNVDLSDDIRGVFDRLLATDDEIARMQKRMGITQSVFRSPEEAGMTPERWAEHLKEKEEATSRVARATELRMMKDVLRERESWWQDELAKMRELAERDYEDIPERGIQRFLRGLTLDEDGITEKVGTVTAMDRKAVVAAVGEEAAKKFILGKNAVSPDEMARIFGFHRTGEQMLKAILALPAKAKWAKETAEARMKEKHGDLLADTERLREVVAKGLHGDNTARWLLKELEALRKKSGNPNGPPVEAIKRAAQLLVERRTVRKLDANTALRQERAAAGKALKAATKGDYAQAYVFTQQQLLNMYLWRELEGAREDREKLTDLASDLSQNKARARLGKVNPVYRGGVDLLLQTFGLTEPVETDEPLPSLNEVVATMQADAATVMFDTELLGRLIAKPKEWKDLTVAEMRELLAALKNIKAAASARATVLLDGKRADKAEVVAHLVSEAKTFGAKGEQLASSRSAETLAQKAGGLYNLASGSVLKIETMAKWLGGEDLKSTWFRAIVLPLEQAKHRKVDILKGTIRPIIDAFEKMPKAVRASFMDSIDGLALFPDHKVESGQDLAPPSRRYELLMMALNSGNDSNLQRLLEGRNITPAQLSAALNLLTKEEMDWVQSVWDSFESLWPEMAALEERDSGLRPPKIAPKPLETKHGTYRGGYFPALYDSRVEELGTKQEAQTLAEMQDVSYTRPGTSHGHLKSRAQTFSGVISLEPANIAKHLAQAAHDLSHREAVKSVGSLIINPEVQAALKTHLGEGRAGQFLQWVKDVGSDRGIEGFDHATAFTKILRAIKGNTVIAALGFNVKNAVEDISNLPAALAATDLSPKHLGVALTEMGRRPMQTVAFAESKSGELRARHDDLQRALGRKLTEITTGRNPASRALRAIKDHAFILQDFTGTAIGTPIWLGAYRQALAAGETDEFAVTKADATVRQALGSHAPVDQAGILRNKGVVGHMLFFFSFLSTMGNNVANLIHRFKHADDAKGRGAAALRLFAYMTASMVFSEFLRGRAPEDDEGWAAWFLRKTMTGTISTVPFGGDAANFIDAKILDKRTNPRSTSIVGVASALGEAAWDAATDETKEWDEKTRKLIQAFGPVIGIPTSQFLATGGYVTDVAQGDIKPTGPVDALFHGFYGQKPQSRSPKAR